MFKWNHTMKLGTRVTVMVAVLMILTLVVVGYISYNSSSNALFTSYEASLTTEATQIAQIVSKEIKSYRINLSDTADVLSVTTSLTGKKAALAQSQQKMGYAYIGYTDSNGATVSSDDRVINLSNTQGYSQALEGEMAITRSEVLESDGQLYFYTFTPVTSGNSVIGVITALISYDAINAPIKDIKIGQTGFPIILDKDGSVNTHPKIDLVIEKSNAINDSKSDPKLEPMAALLKKCINRETGFGQYEFMGVVKYMTFAPIEGTDWSLMLAVPKAELFTDITKQSKAILISSAVAFITIMTALVLFIRYQVSNPLKRTANLAIELASGNLDANIKIKSKDEVGQLAATIDNEVRRAFKSIEQARIDLDTAAEQLASGSKQVSEGSQTISVGASEQASSLEELTSSVTQVAAQTKQNAESADRANKLSLTARDSASQGNEQMKDMQKAMADINESSSSISKIIKVIDDIAFQTNILSLNAAVEAARAGIHGKGFAVVAEEVRNLAAKSADAAKETTELIEGSIRNVQSGTHLADETAKSLVSIVQSVEEAVHIVGEIAAASNEQATAIAQINTGLEQLSKVVQTNSATAEETAAASEELSSQAALLKGMVEMLKISSTDENQAPEKVEPTQSNPKKESSAQPKPSVINLDQNEFGKY